MPGTALDKWMWRIAYLYLVIPFLIFSIGWLKWFYGVPLAAIVLFACMLSIRRHKSFIAIDLKKHKRIIGTCIALLFAWVFFSGIGQFSYQNGDHYARNAILNDLVEKPWPLVYDFSQWQPYGVEPGEYMLVYYVGYWMPAALAGKMFGVQAAHSFLFLWTLLGVILVFYFICRNAKAARLWMLLLFILFGGMDVIPALIKGNYEPTLHLEWWRNAYQQYTSNTSLLYWVFNQVIAPWLVIGMFFNGTPKQNTIFLCALCFFYAPFPFLGLVPFAVYFFFEGNRTHWYRNILTFQNSVAAIPVMVIMMGYYSGASADKNFNWYIRPFGENLYFYTIEFLIVATILLITSKRKLLILVATASLVLLSFIQYRHTPDLMMRASIPALFVLMIVCTEQLLLKKNKTIAGALACLLIIGCISSLNEIDRSVYYTAKYWHAKHVKKEAPEFELIRQQPLFSGANPVIVTMLSDTDSVFYQTFCRQKR